MSSCSTWSEASNAYWHSRIYSDPYGIRTRVTAVKGRCLNRLTKGPSLKTMHLFVNWICELYAPPSFNRIATNQLSSGASSRARTGDLFLTMEALYLAELW